MMCPSSPSAINAAISAATRPAFNAYDPSRVPKSSVFGVASIISRLSCGQEIDDLPSAKDFQNSLCASWKIEKSRRSAMQKERSSGIILSYKSTKKASFFLVGKARRCVRGSSDISSSIKWSPQRRKHRDLRFRWDARAEARPGQRTWRPPAAGLVSPPRSSWLRPSRSESPGKARRRRGCVMRSDQIHTGSARSFLQRSQRGNTFSCKEWLTNPSANRLTCSHSGWCEPKASCAPNSLLLSVTPSFSHSFTFLEQVHDRLPHKWLACTNYAHSFLCLRYGDHYKSFSLDLSQPFRSQLSHTLRCRQRPGGCGDGCPAGPNPWHQRQRQ